MDVDKPRQLRRSNVALFKRPSAEAKSPPAKRPYRRSKEAAVRAVNAQNRNSNIEAVTEDEAEKKEAGEETEKKNEVVRKNENEREEEEEPGEKEEEKKKKEESEAANKQTKIVRKRGPYRKKPRAPPKVIPCVSSRIFVQISPNW